MTSSEQEEGQLTEFYCDVYFHEYNVYQMKWSFILIYQIPPPPQ